MCIRDRGKIALENRRIKDSADLIAQIDVISGLAEAAEQQHAIVVGEDVTCIGLGRTPLVRQTAERIEAALAASGADLVLVVTEGVAGLVSVEPLLEAGWPLVVCVAMCRTSRTQAESIVRFARDREATVLGTIVLGAHRSEALYCPPC